MVLLIAFALVAAACSSDEGGDTESTTTTTAAPAETTTTAPAETTTTSTEPALARPYGGEVIVADSQEPPTLNQWLPGGNNLIVSFISEGYATGVQQVSGFTLEYIPEIVTEMPSVSNGGITINADGTMTVKYTILDEVKWSDGTDLTGADFQFTYDTIMNEDYPITRTTYEDITATVVGNKTFEYTLAAPTATYEIIFNEIFPKHDLEGKDFVNDYNDKRWVSSGPFVFDEWAKGEFITLVKNPNYWKNDPETGQALPYLDSVTWRFIGETEAVLTAFKAREVDIINPDPNTDNIQTLQELVPDGAIVEVMNGAFWEHLNFQFGPDRFVRNENSCTENLAARQAVAHAINTEVITDDILAGQVEPLSSYIDVFLPAASQGAWDQYDFNPTKAGELWAQAVVEEGRDCSIVFTTTSNNTARVRLSELFLTMFEEAGIPYEADLEDSQLFFGETFVSGTWDVGEWAWVAAPGLANLISIHDVFDPESPPPDGNNMYNWGTEGSSEFGSVATVRFAEVRDEMNATVDDAELLALFNEAEDLIADNVVIIPLYARLSVGAAWGDEVGNFKHNPTGYGHGWNQELWYRVDLEG
jgi:peptide/nickel transport system substrate-binding protein